MELQDCCSRAESFAASSISIPHNKEEIELILHRELPRVCLCLNGRYIEKANPGKAFENTTQKMVKFFPLYLIVSEFI